MKEIRIIDNLKLRRNCKTKRLRTLLKNCVEVAAQCDLLFDMVVYNPRQNKMQEFYTDEKFSQKYIDNMIKGKTTLGGKKLTNGQKPVKFETKDAMVAYRTRYQKKLQ